MCRITTLHADGCQAVCNQQRLPPVHCTAIIRGCHQPIAPISTRPVTTNWRYLLFWRLFMFDSSMTTSKSIAFIIRFLGRIGRMLNVHRLTLTLRTWIPRRCRSNAHRIILSLPIEARWVSIDIPCWFIGRSLVVNVARISHSDARSSRRCWWHSVCRRVRHIPYSLSSHHRNPDYMHSTLFNVDSINFVYRGHSTYHQPICLVLGNIGLCVMETLWYRLYASYHCERRQSLMLSMKTVVVVKTPLFSFGRITFGWKSESLLPSFGIDIVLLWEAISIATKMT